jgi:hypothetical protein
MLAAFKAAMIRDGCFGCAATSGRRWAIFERLTLAMLISGNTFTRGSLRQNWERQTHLQPSANTYSSLRTVSDIMHHARPHWVVTRGLLSHSTQSEPGFKETSQPTAKRRGTPVQTSQETSSPLLLDLGLSCDDRVS